VISIVTPYLTLNEDSKGAQRKYCFVDELSAALREIVKMIMGSFELVSFIQG